jgi:tetratricopeptide (TPR) repeat protein
LEFLSQFGSDPSPDEMMDLEVEDLFYSSKDMDGLVGKGIVERTGDSLHLHDLVKDVVGSTLDRERSEAINRTIAMHYMEALEKERGGTRATGLEAISRRTPLLKRTFDHLARSASTEDLFLALSDHGDELISLSELDMVLDLTEGRIDRLSFLKRDLDPEVLGRVLLFNGWCHFIKGSPEVALSRYSEALSIASSTEGPELSARCRNAIGTIHLTRREYPLARDLIGSSIADLTRPEDIAKARSNLAIIEWREGNLDAALREIDSALGISRRSGDRPGIARASINKGIILWQKGDLAKALTAYREALGICEEDQYLHMNAMVNDNLGELMKTMGDIEAAKGYFSGSVTIAEGIGFHAQVAESTRNLALLEEDPKRKKALLLKAISHFERSGNDEECRQVRDLMSCIE